jgi:uncharacterized cupredoxin-like copper-binding protein
MWMALLALVMLVGTGCSSGSSSSGKTVKVELGDFTITPSPSSVAAGEITFKVHNSGGFVHELVVMRVAKVSDIPVKKNGEANEDAVPEPQHMGEVEDVAPGQTANLKLTLGAGTYVLLCNRTDGTVAHYQKGMRTEFTVT